MTNEYWQPTVFPCNIIWTRDQLVCRKSQKDGRRPTTNAVLGTIISAIHKWMNGKKLKTWVGSFQGLIGYCCHCSLEWHNLTSVSFSLPMLGLNIILSFWGCSTFFSNRKKITFPPRNGWMDVTSLHHCLLPPSLSPAWPDKYSGRLPVSPKSAVPKDGLLHYSRTHTLIHAVGVPFESCPPDHCGWMGTSFGHNSSPQVGGRLGLCIHCTAFLWTWITYK